MPILPLKYDMFYFVPLNSILWNIKTLRKEEWKEKGKQDMSNGGKKKERKVHYIVSVDYTDYLICNNILTYLYCGYLVY